LIEYGAADAQILVRLADSDAAWLHKNSQFELNSVLVVKDR